MTLKIGDRLYALTRTAILEVSVVAIEGSRYIMDGFIDGRGRLETKKLTAIELDSKQFKPVCTCSEVRKFYVSRIIALTHFHENITIEMEQKTLILPKHQLENILNDTLEQIEDHRTNFFTKNIPL